MKKPLIPGALLLSAIIVLTSNLEAATLTVQPNTVTTTSAAEIVLQISGLATGESVTIERIIDANGNGVADRGELVVQTFNVTDNQAATIGGVRNSSVPGDEDSANGAIRTELNFAAGSEVLRSAGKFLFRSTGSSGAATAPFTVNHPNLGQTISGTVRSGGTPVSGAVVVLLDSAQDGEVVTGSITDANGNYSINAAPGMYGLLPVKPGYISDFSQAPQVNLGPGQNLTSDLLLNLATGATVSGRFYDADDTTKGVPVGQLLFSTEEGLISLAFTGADGSYSLKLPPAQWILEGIDEGPVLYGYMGTEDEFLINATAGDVRQDVPLEKGTSLVYGSVKRADNNTPLAGVAVGVDNFSVGLAVETLTDADGNYAVAVADGQWYVRASHDQILPEFRAYLFGSGESITLSTGESRRIDITALPATSTITGSVKTSTGTGLPFIGVYAVATINGKSLQANGETDEQGNYTLPVIDGSWSVGVSNTDLSELGLQSPQSQTITVSGTAVANFVARAPSSHIRGRVVDDTGAPVASIQVNAFPSGGGFAQAQTDANGNFDLGVEGGTWTLNLEMNAATLRGYISPSLTVQVPTNGDVNNVVLTARRAIRHIRGTLKTSTGTPISGIWVSGSADVNGISYYSSTQTGGDGAFSLLAFPGEWWINASSFDLEQQGLIAPPTVQRTVGDADITVDFVASTAGSTISGRVVDGSGTGVASIGLSAFRPNGPSFNARTDASGNFTFNVSAGEYFIQVSSSEAAQRGLITPQVSVTVPEGGNVANVVLTVRTGTSQILGRLTDSTGNGIGNVLICATIFQNGTTYSTQGVTEPDGDFGLAVFNGSWFLFFCGNELQNLGYVVPEGRTITVNGPGAWRYDVTVQRAGDAPQISTVSRLPGGSIQIRGTDTLSRPRHIEVSTNLDDWSLLQTLPATGTTFEYTDPFSNLPMRFYRVRVD